MQLSDRWRQGQTGWTWLTFDCYGTLIDWETGLRHAVAAVADWTQNAPDAEALYRAYLTTEMQVEAEPYRRYADVLAETLRRLSGRFGFQVDPRRRNALAESMRNWQPFPDTVDALKRLKKRFRLGILSNVDRDLFAETARRLEVEFDLVITAEDVRAYKPARAHFERMLETVGPAESVLHVAQSLHHDMAPTEAMGLYRAWINRRGEINTLGVTVDAEFSNLSALADALSV